MGTNRQLLDVADTLETLFKNQERDLDATYRMLAREQQEKQAVQEELGRKAQQVAVVQEELRLILLKYQALEEWKRIDLARRFGARSERWTSDDQSQALMFNELETSLAPAETTRDTAPVASSSTNVTAKTEKPRGKREALPESLPRQVTVIELTASEKVCSACGKQMSRIGEETSEQLQVRPIEFYVEKIIRPTYACSCGCGGAHAAAVPPQIYPKAILGDTVLSQIIASKYCDALPFYRQERILGRSGIEISRQTMARSAKAVAEWLAPLEKLLNERLARCAVICADETRLRVLKENGIKKDGQSYMWVATGEDANGSIVKFHYGGGRGAAVARKLLGDFKGILMCDGYGAYPSAVTGGPITLAACLAHVRRQFHDVLKGDSRNPRACEAMEFIGQLYAVEKQAADMTGPDRLRLRQERARPVFEAFRAWLYVQVGAVAPVSALGKAVKYAVTLLGRLEVYLHDGAVPIDNNRAENAIRPFVVGRKNWLFSAEVDGAAASATLYSIIETAKANLLEPMHYLRFLFACHRKFGAAMPWAKLVPRPELRSHAEAIGVPWEFA